MGLIQEWRLFDILAFKVGTFFWGAEATYYRVSYSNCLKCGKVNIKVLYSIYACMKLQTLTELK